MRKQQGFSGMSILIIAVVCIFGLFTTLKVFPFYTDNWSVETVFKNLQEEASDKDYNRREIHSMIQKRFDINGISQLMEYVEVSGKGSTIIIDMEYERRTSLISNIELVATFNHYIDFSE